MDELTESISKTEDMGPRESANIREAIIYLRSLSDGSGLLDVEGVIRKTHKILMKGIRDDGGQFSFNLKTATFKGKKIIYPTFLDHNLTYTALLFLTDLYNDSKNAVKFLFTFLYLHPFGDGNGRLAKLILSYCSNWKKTTFPPQEKYLTALTSIQKGLPKHEFIDTRDKALKTVYAVWNADTRELEKLLLEELKPV